jgi:adenosylmethionine-8-amino-7-oxononanoate aminotransferase
MEGPLFDGVSSLRDHPLVGESRGGVGLLAAIDFAPDALEARPAIAQDVFRHARERGVIVRPLATGVAVSPPLTVQAEHVDLLVETVRAALDDVR